MAALIITLITIIVITLIVLGFASISRREQRSSLDQQLSAQAFYAAESAVEDVKQVLEQAIATGQNLVNKDDCTANNPGGVYPTGAATVIDQDNDISYSCLKVNVNPTSATYDGVGEQSIIIPLKSSQPMDRLEIIWSPTTPPTTAPGADCPPGVANEFAAQTAWSCGYAVLRMDMAATANGLSRVGLVGNTTTAFFAPTTAGGTGQQSYAAGRQQANVVAADCDLAAYSQCRAVITDLAGQTEFALRVNSLYKQSNLSVTGYAGDTPVSFSGAQAVVDATGKAQDVLRRIQVRLPLKPIPATPPNYAIQSNHALCKRFQVDSGYFNIPGDILNPDTQNLMCVPKTDGQPPVPPCVPIHDIMLTLDTSGSMKSSLAGTTGRSAMEQLQEVARRFVTGTNIAPDTNHVGIVRFSSDGELGVGLTSDQNALVAYIRSLTPDGGTQYLKGLNVTINEFNGPRVRPGSPRVLIFVSDGQPSDDKGQIRATSSNIKDAGVRLYTIGINSQSQVNIPNLPGNININTGYDEQLLMDMAGNGGRYFAADDEASLQAALQAISDDLRCGTTALLPSGSGRPAVETLVDRPQVRVGDVGINLRRRDIAMA